MMYLPFVISVGLHGEQICTNEAPSCLKSGPGAGVPCMSSRKTWWVTMHGEVWVDGGGAMLRRIHPIY